MFLKSENAREVVNNAFLDLVDAQRGSKLAEHRGHFSLDQGIGLDGVIEIEVDADIQARAVIDDVVLDREADRGDLPATHDDAPRLTVTLGVQPELFEDIEKRLIEEFSESKHVGSWLADRSDGVERELSGSLQPTAPPAIGPVEFPFRVVTFLAVPEMSIASLPAHGDHGIVLAQHEGGAPAGVFPHVVNQSLLKRLNHGPLKARQEVDVEDRVLVRSPLFVQTRHPWPSAPVR